MRIDESNSRRFRHQDGVAVLAIYDARRGFNLYGEVYQQDDGTKIIDDTTVRAYWDDEMEELR